MTIQKLYLQTDRELEAPVNGGQIAFLGSGVQPKLSAKTGTLGFISRVATLKSSAVPSVARWVGDFVD